LGKTIDALSDEERIAYYRSLALEALKHARDTSTDEQRAAFLKIAASWASLADEVGRLAQCEAEMAERFFDPERAGDNGGQH
jgi:hypothetical protein